MNVVAVIVTYNPGEELAKNVVALASQVDHIIVVDNGSSKPPNLSPTLTFLHNTTNLGLATALNQGVKAALAKGADWIITFDQDSIATPNFVAGLFAAYEACPYAAEVMVVGSTYQDPTSGEIVSLADDKSSPLYRTATYTWTSGCLMNARVFTTVGYFRDEFFIDYIDIEYCLRCQRQGFKILESARAVLLHNVGQPSQRRFLGKLYSTSNHSALRRYYSARNRTRVYFEYWGSHRRWILKDLKIYFTQLRDLFLVEEQRWLKLSYVLRGIRDGLMNRGGKYN